jgi:hypothetical protein
LARYLAIGDEARIRDPRFAARSHPSVDFSASGFITLNPLQTHAHACPRSTATATSPPSPSARQERFVTRALCCGVEELVAQLGTDNAIKRVETELRRAKRARSRKLHAFWSAILVRIETETESNGRRNTRPARSAQPMAMAGHDGRAQD